MNKNNILIYAIALIIIVFTFMLIKNINNKMEIKSYFSDNEIIPVKYTCDGDNINPMLEISNIPKGTKTLALIMHDPDAPREGGFTHWVMWNILVSEKVIINENSFLGVQGTNSANQTKYAGPCPPLGVHRYFFTFYALDSELNIKSSATKQVLENAMMGHIVGQAELVGVYSR